MLANLKEVSRKNDDQMNEWISVKKRLPPIGENWSVWVYDNTDIFISDWGKIDCDYRNKFEKTKGFWFGDIDGTECFSAHENITHWMEIQSPLPPKENNGKT